jgi:hypothetical protein
MSRSVLSAILRLAPFAATATVALACSSSPAPTSEETESNESAATACEVHAERSLVIVDRGALDSPAPTSAGGAWHFATVLGSLLAPSADARSFVTDAFAPPAVRHQWPLTPEGKLDLAAAPYRLAAVILRPEGTWSSLGELRLVFEANAGGSLGVLTSFEYAMDWRKPPPGEPATAPAPTTLAEASARRAAWIAAWRSLETTPFGSAAYGSALASLTEAVTRQPGQLRIIGVETRQPSPAGSFRFTSFVRGGWLGLQASNLPGTPPSDWNTPGFTWNAGGNTCGGWSGGACSVADPLVHLVASRESELYAGTFSVPTELRAHDVIGSASSAWGTKLDPPSGWTQDRWQRARRALSRGTCDGCHGADTGTAGQHIVPQATGAATLSAFVRDQELPQRQLAYRATLCGASSLPAGITELPAGGIEVGASCSTAGAIVSEPCGGTGKRFAVCVNDGAKLVLSERTSCIDERRPECASGVARELPCERCGTRRDACIDFRWSGGWCSTQGACEPNAVDHTTAGCATPGTSRARTCSTTCAWTAYGSCAPP